MIYKMCHKCKLPIIHPNVYCTKCQKIIDENKEQLKKDRESKYNKKRDPKYKMFYNSSSWKILKEKKMQQEEYLCERCFSKGIRKLAEEVHHIKYIQYEEGWELRLCYENLEALCLDCHNYRHKRFQKGKVKQI